MLVFRHVADCCGVSPSRGLCVQRTRTPKTRSIIHALSTIRTHDLSVQAAKIQAPEHKAIVIGTYLNLP
jgi:hypothetical protein